MTDEKYTFVQDVKEKKSTARGARNKRTHCGKRGAVKLPSDYLSKKELNAMNGEVKSYRLNEPMNWDEFKSMPDDIKTSYIQLIRERFHVSDSSIARMLGATQSNFSHLARRLDIGLGRGTGNQKCDKEGFLRWQAGIVLPADESEQPECIAEPVPEGETVLVHEEKAKAVIRCGSMTLEGAADEALSTISTLLGGANARITIAWEVCSENGREANVHAEDH